MVLTIHVDLAFPSRIRDFIKILVNKGRIVTPHFFSRIVPNLSLHGL